METSRPKLRSVPPDDPAVNGLDDAALAAALVQNVPGATTAAWHRYAPLVYRMSRRILGSHDVDDVVQEVFLRVFDRIGTLRQPDRLTAFVAAFAAKVAAWELRKRRVRRFILLTDDGISPGVAKELTAFRASLPAEDKVRMDAQLDAVRILEKRLASPAAGSDATGCKKPNVGSKLDVSRGENYPATLRATTEAVVSALACDLTRVVYYGANATQTPGDNNFAPVNMGQGEHSLSHDHLDGFDRLRTFYMAEVAHLADRLSQIPEGDGTMLDNTIILFASEISRGHSHTRMPFVTVGGKNMGVNVGRYLNLPKVRKNPFKHRADEGYPHGRLFVSICNAFGLRDETFGLPELNRDPMDGFLKT